MSDPTRLDVLRGLLSGGPRAGRNIMLTVTLLLLLAAFVCAIGAAMGRVPLWVAVVLLCVVGLLGALPR